MSLQQFLSKWRGADAPIPPRAPTGAILLAGFGGLLAISLAGSLAQLSATPLMLGSLGASCVLAFGFSEAPFSQPRNIIAGHVLSSAIGLACVALFGAHPLTAGLAVGLSIAAMMATRTVHPPAGSNPVIVFLAQPGWSFLLFPTLAGAAIIVLVALVYNNLARSKRYPAYW